MIVGRLAMVKVPKFVPNDAVVAVNHQLRSISTISRINPPPFELNPPPLPSFVPAGHQGGGFNSARGLGVGGKGGERRAREARGGRGRGVGGVRERGEGRGRKREAKGGRKGAPKLILSLSRFRLRLKGN